MRQVKRTYYSKKSGTYVTKIYSYANRSRQKSPTLVGLGGKINKTYKQRINKLLEDAREQDDMALEMDIQRIVTEAKMKGKKLTEKSLISKLLEDKTMKMIVNAGYEIDEAADLMNTTEMDLIDPRNWDGSVFTNPTDGRSYEFKFSYTDNAFIEIL